MIICTLPLGADAYPAEVSVPGGAKKNNANTAGKSGAPRIKEQYCNVCNKNINLGNGGGPAHVENVANVKKTRPITNYFSSKPAVASTSTPSTTPASSNSVPISDPTPSASTSRIIDDSIQIYLHTRWIQIDMSADPCGFCVGTQSHCSIVLVKRKGTDGAIRIDQTRSRCPNLTNLPLESAAKSSERSPCTNRPMVCPVSPCPDIKWKYGLQSHIRTIHPTANLSNYRSYYALAEGEEITLKTISTTKKCKSSKKAITFKISPDHSTEAALGMGPSRSPSPNAEQEIATRSTPHSLWPLHEDSEDDDMPSPTPLEFAPLNEEDDDMPSPGALLEASSRSGSFNIPPPIIPDCVDPASINQTSELPTILTPQPSESMIPPAIRPQPRRVLKKTLDIAPPIAATNAEPTATRRSTRVAVPSKHRMVVLWEEDEEEETTTCSVPYCAVTGDVPQIGCSGPACDSQKYTRNKLGIARFVTLRNAVLSAKSREYIASRKVLPINPYGQWKQSMLADEDLANDIRDHLQELGKFITADKLVDYLSREDVKGCGMGRGWEQEGSVGAGKV
ncbi:hypothetical protein B0H10DRAFT_1948012 [Mycena sp. CBHHK59/15]|nr:hypothetical protein B0H10DRAFT_1948012 [Mycena sp. CBHHK59/15]